jgi:hypothetical protein
VLFPEGEIGVANSKDKDVLVTEQPGFVSEQPDFSDATRVASQMDVENAVPMWHDNYTGHAQWAEELTVLLGGERNPHTGALASSLI